MNLIEQNDAKQMLRCRHCCQHKFVPFRTWIRPEEKLAVVEAFQEAHESCQEQAMRDMRLRFFARPGKA